MRRPPKRGPTVRRGCDRNPDGQPCLRGVPANQRQTGPMGMDPTRRHVRRNSDYVFVAAALIVAVALVAWAFLG